MLEEVYSDHALSKSQCYRWFKKFQSGDFELDNEPHGKPPQKFEDAELQALLDEDSTQMQEKLAKQLQVSQGAVSLRLNSLGMTQKISRWVPHEHENKSFLHRIVTSDEKWIHFSNPTYQRSWGLPGQFPKETPRPNCFGKKAMLCVWWDQTGVVYFELLKPGETRFGYKVESPKVAASKRRLKKEETVEDYFRDKIRSLNQTSLNNVEKLKMLTDGLPLDWKNYLVTAQPKDPSHWMQIAMEIEQNNNQIRQQQRRKIGLIIDTKDKAVYVKGNECFYISPETHLPSVQQKELNQLLKENQALFSQHETDIGRIAVQHKNHTIEHPPISCRPYRRPLAEYDEIKRQAEELSKKGLIRESQSPWAFPVVLVSKKDGSQRMCIDYRKLNAITIDDKQPLPYIQDMFDRLHNAKYFTTLDMAWGYWHVEIHPDSVE
ncbi:SETMAR [Cordylochernes scorpioides]|uniref:SETMAR n=1 Tax=Cordylochernes scorpioides TaxID=51811 RepID=A0ABY6K7Y8_9ARAC|nr:SETMAR [Cordylochernes scorpioides]